MSRSASVVAIGDAEIELRRFGTGKPLLLLSGEDLLEPDAPFAAELAAEFEIFAPSPPGFGASNRPEWITAPDDIAYLYLSLIEQLGLDNVTVLGCSLGGWIAAEMATKNDARLARLVLVDPYGIKPGGPAERDIADIWQLSPAKVATLKWRNPESAKRDTAKLSDAQLGMIARNRESFARFCWEPYMHNPKLKHRLARIGVPTLLIWGEADGIVTPSYGAAYAKLIPGAAFKTVPDAAHYPHLEQKDLFLRLIRDFLGNTTGAATVKETAR